MENDENFCYKNENSDEKSIKIQEEGPTTVPQPAVDVYFTANELVILDLLNDQHRYHAQPAYCVYEPPTQAIWMRRALLNWLREVCEHRNTDAEILAHTAQLIDRYLQIVPTNKREYQLVGAACFLISSKLKETVPVSVERMVQYTDFSVTKQDLLAKEITICLSLQWDLTGISPIDFIRPTIDFLPFTLDLRQLIRRSAVKIFMKILHVEGINFYSPAYVAASCILYALQLIVTMELGNLLPQMQSLLQLDARTMHEVYQFLSTLFKPGTVELSDAVIRVDQGPPPIVQPTISSEKSHLADLHDPSQLSDAGPIPGSSTPSNSIQDSSNRQHQLSSSVCSTASSSSAVIASPLSDQIRAQITSPPGLSVSTAATTSSLALSTTNGVEMQV